jgi:hypothetical protein
VDGTVVNQTTGKPQAGATVSLFKLTQAGPESLESTKSDAQGRFTIKAEVQGPRLLQAAYDGVVYNRMLPPGTPGTGVTMAVYDSSKKPGDAKVAQHMILLEPSGDQMNVSEAYIFQNTGKLTYEDPDSGTLQFYLPTATKGLVKVEATEPQGLPLPQAATKTGKADIYKVDFPLKPGETRIDLAYVLPSASGTTFEGKVLYSGGPTRLVTPNGVTLSGDSIASLGPEPRTQANIYDVKSASFMVQVQGTGSLRAAADNNAAGGDDSGDSGPQIEAIAPRIYCKMPLILGLALGVLAIGFVLLYRMPAAAKGNNERSRR